MDDRSFTKLSGPCDYTGLFAIEELVVLIELTFHCRNNQPKLTCDTGLKRIIMFCEQVQWKKSLFNTVKYVANLLIPFRCMILIASHAIFLTCRM